MRMILTLVMAGCLAIVLAAAQSRSAADQYQEALRLEEVKGDLKGAIEQYRKLTQGADRAIAAKALVQMAGCYEKLGQSDARGAYERVVREFADQAESVATARTRLASMRSIPAAGSDIAFRRVGDGSQNEHGAAVSYDGRYIVHHLHPDELGTLAVRDLATGRVHPLAVRSPDSRDQPDVAVVSRDSKMVAYAWETSEGNAELRTIPLQTSTPGQPRRLFRGEDVWIAPYDWSPDGTQIAVRVERVDRTVQIGLVSTADGSLKVLKSAESADRRVFANAKMSFSPDGRYLAYDMAQVDNSEQRDVFVMTVDGSRDVAAVAHPSYNALAGWSPDGTYLLFFSDRTGSRGLWSQAVVDGRPQGAAALIKADLGSSSMSLGITASGALYVLSPTGNTDIEVVPVDFATGQIAGNPVRPVTEYVGANSQPEWSSDGRFMSYVSRREGRLVLAMRELATGSVRVVRPELSNIGSKTWSPDRKLFAVQGTDLKGRRGLFLVDAETSDALPTVMTAGVTPRDGVAWSPDGRKLYYGGRVDTQSSIFERDMVSGEEREITRRPTLSSHLSLSPDGRWIATVTRDAVGSAAILVPASGGEVRELMRSNRSMPGLAIVLWSPGSDSVIVKRGRNLTIRVEPVEYWRVAISGGEPRETELRIDSATSPQFTWPHLHADGRQVAYTTSTVGKDEVWVLENFLPKTGGGR